MTTGSYFAAFLILLLIPKPAGAEKLLDLDTMTVELFYAQSQADQLSSGDCLEPSFAHVCLKGHSVVFEIPAFEIDAETLNEECSVFIALYAEEKNGVAHVTSSLTSDCSGFVQLPKRVEKKFVRDALRELTKWIRAIRGPEL